MFIFGRIWGRVCTARNIACIPAWRTNPIAPTAAAANSSCSQQQPKRRVQAPAAICPQPLPPSPFPPFLGTDPPMLQVCRTFGPLGCAGVCHWRACGVRGTAPAGDDARWSKQPVSQSASQPVGQAFQKPVGNHIPLHPPTLESSQRIRCPVPTGAEADVGC